MKLLVSFNDAFGLVRELSHRVEGLVLQARQPELLGTQSRRQMTPRNYSLASTHHCGTHVPAHAHTLTFSLIIIVINKTFLKGAFSCKCYFLFEHIKFQLRQDKCRHYDLHNLQNSERTGRPLTRRYRKRLQRRRGNHHYLFVMGDQLGLHVAGHEVHSPQHLPGLQAPDGAGCVNA